MVKYVVYSLSELSRIFRLYNPALPYIDVQVAIIFLREKIYDNEIQKPCMFLQF